MSISTAEMRFLLDTNIIIALSKRRPGVGERVGGIPAADVGLSSIVVGEIEYGIAKSRRRLHNRRVFDALLAGFRVVPFDAAAAREYGLIRAALERRGRLIGPHDLLIAAHARSIDATLVTDNTSEFSRVERLRITNWLRD